MKFWGTPAGAGMLVGIAMAIVTLFGLLPDGIESWVAIPILFGFAFWLSRWVRYRVFAPGIWLGAFLTLWAPILHTILLPVYLTYHPDAETMTRGAFLGESLLRALFSTVLLALVASLLAIGPRRRDQARMAEETAPTA